MHVAFDDNFHDYNEKLMEICYLFCCIFIEIYMQWDCNIASMRNNKVIMILTMKNDFIIWTRVKVSHFIFTSMKNVENVENVMPHNFSWCDEKLNFFLFVESVEKLCFSTKFALCNIKHHHKIDRTTLHVIVNENWYRILREMEKEWKMSVFFE